MTAFASEVIADILVLQEGVGRVGRETPEWAERACKKCKVTKPVDDYYLRSPNSQGLKKPNIVCKSCVLAEAKARKAGNGQGILLSQPDA